MSNDPFVEHLEQLQDVFREYEFFFVLGAPKSGTTWLQKALNAHSQVVCVGEGHFVDKFVSLVGPALKQYFDHQAVVARNVYEGNAGYRHDRQASIEFLAKAFVLDAFARLERPAGTRWVGDKTPANVEHLGSLYRLFPDAKFINIVRDGRDTLVSTFKHAERVMRANGHKEDLAGFLLEKTGNYTNRWARSLEVAETFSREHPGSLHTLRYEDLKNDFAATLGRALTFLGADVNEDEIGRCETESSFKKLSGGRDVGQEDPNAFVRKGIVGDWRANLNEQHLEIFNAQGARWLAHYGYE